VLGVLAGLEVLRSVKEASIKPHASLAVVCWTNEFVQITARSHAKMTDIIIEKVLVSCLVALDRLSGRAIPA